MLFFREKRVKLVKKIILFFMLLHATSACAFSEVLFSPDDHPTTRLIQMLNGAQQKIHAAVYMITDKDIAKALVDAKKRGVDVRIIVDPSSVNTSFGKGKLLIENQIDTFVFTTPRHKKKQTFHLPLMHNKFALIDNKLWNGSFNWTISANKQNQENVVITDDQAICKKFEQHFSILEKRCIPYISSCRKEYPTSLEKAAPQPKKEDAEKKWNVGEIVKQAAWAWWTSVKTVWEAVFA